MFANYLCVYKTDVGGTSQPTCEVGGKHQLERGREVLAEKEAKSPDCLSFPGSRLHSGGRRAAHRSCGPHGPQGGVQLPQEAWHRGYFSRLLPLGPQLCPAHLTLISPRHTDSCCLLCQPPSLVPNSSLPNPTSDTACWTSPHPAFIPESPPPVSEH